MAFSRYKNDYNIGGQLESAKSIYFLRQMIKNGNILISSRIIATGNDRLDSLAGSIYGDSKYWWVLAAASGIGWGLQIPPGTIINIVDLREVERIV